MTRDEAIDRIRDMISPMPSAERDNIEALCMALEALKATEHDGCEGCKYINKDQYEMPCLMCKQSKKDLWERR